MGKPTEANEPHPKEARRRTGGRIGVARRTCVFRGWRTFPAWSPDGSEITFDRDLGGVNFEIYLMNADGTGVRRLTNDPADDFAPAWSPAGGAS